MLCCDILHFEISRQLRHTMHRLQRGQALHQRALPHDIIIRLLVQVQMLAFLFVLHEWSSAETDIVILVLRPAVYMDYRGLCIFWAQEWSVVDVALEYYVLCTALKLLMNNCHPIFRWWIWVRSFFITILSNFNSRIYPLVKYHPLHNLIHLLNIITI